MAAISRASVRRVRVEPRRSNSRSCKTRKQLRLELQRHFADLVQEHGAAIGQLKAAHALRNRAGKGSALVAEHFAFEQARWESPRS